MCLCLCGFFFKKFTHPFFFSFFLIFFFFFFLRQGSKIVVNGKSGKDSTTYLLDHTSPRPPLLSDPWETVSFHELPEWLQDNELLHHHHRPQLSTYARCFASIFRLHTETGNIWTHLIGFLGFLAICAATYSSSLLEYPWEDKAVFAAFFVGITVCLLMSTTFHTVCCHSKMASKVIMNDTIKERGKKNIVIIYYLE